MNALTPWFAWLDRLIEKNGLENEAEIQQWLAHVASSDGSPLEEHTSAQEWLHLRCSAALLAAENEEPAQARACYQRVLDLCQSDLALQHTIEWQPYQLQALEGCAHIAMCENDLESASRAYEAMLELQPQEDTETRTMLLQLYLTLGMLDASATLLDQSPELPQTVRLFSRALLDFQKLADAHARFHHGETVAERETDPHPAVASSRAALRENRLLAELLNHPRADELCDLDAELDAELENALDLYSDIAMAWLSDSEALEWLHEQAQELDQLHPQPSEWQQHLSGIGGPSSSAQRHKFWKELNESLT